MTKARQKRGGRSRALHVAVVAGLASLALGWMFADSRAPTQAAPTGFTTIFDNLSTEAELISQIGYLTLAVTGVIFVVVGGLLIYIVVRFRGRHEKTMVEPPQNYGSSEIELAWTVVPLMIVIVLGLATARGLWQLDQSKVPPDAVTVRVIGHQWWWEAQYPEYGFTTANEIHIPVSVGEGGRPTLFQLESADVVHSFWVPALGGKMDVVPLPRNAEAQDRNHLVVHPTKPGLFPGRCAEYCGTQHAQMLFRVIVHTPESFERWVAQQRGKAVEDRRVQAGMDVFMKTACINCHTIRGTVATGRFGPDLTHLMSRETLASAIVKNNRETLTQWIEDPDHYKPGVLMPRMKLDARETEELVEYLLSLR